MSVLACLLASVPGLAGGVALAMGGARLRAVLHSVIAVLRGIPVIMMIFWCYFLLPILFGLNVPGTATVISALAVINGACLSQSVHAGLGTLDGGQWEASRAPGLRRWQTLRALITRVEQLEKSYGLPRIKTPVQEADGTWHGDDFTI